jgi:mono/diheme cytochrome c family protein
MADKPAVFRAMTDREAWNVTAYLVAITPDLARASRQRRRQIAARTEAAAQVADLARPAAEPVPPAPPPPGPPPLTLPPAVPRTIPAPPAIDLTRAKHTFEAKCSECHELADVDHRPPRSRAAATALVKRMIDENDAVFTPDEITLIVAWLNAQYVAPRP